MVSISGKHLVRGDTPLASLGSQKGEAILFFWSVNGAQQDIDCLVMVQASWQWTQSPNLSIVARAYFVPLHTSNIEQYQAYIVLALSTQPPPNTH